MEVQLAEALLRRKELQQKVDQLHDITQHDIIKAVVKRVNVADNIDEVRAEVPIVTMGQLKSAYDFYARQLRLVDAAIQRANWETTIAVSDSVMADFVDNLEVVRDNRFE